MITTTRYIMKWLSDDDEETDPQVEKTEDWASQLVDAVVCWLLSYGIYSLGAPALVVTGVYFLGWFFWFASIKSALDLARIEANQPRVVGAA